MTEESKKNETDLFIHDAFRLGRRPAKGSVPRSFVEINEDQIRRKGVSKEGKQVEAYSIGPIDMIQEKGGQGSGPRAGGAGGKQDTYQADIARLHKQFMDKRKKDRKQEAKE